VAYCREVVKERSGSADAILLTNDGLHHTVGFEKQRWWVVCGCVYGRAHDVE